VFACSPDSAKSPIRRLRYLGLANTLKIQLLNRTVASAVASWNPYEELEQAGSWIHGKLVQELAEKFISGYADMDPDCQRDSLCHFLRTGQDKGTVVQQERSSINILIKEGIDAFQPFLRKCHSTLIMCYR